MATPPIYLDNQATTPMDPRVLEAMMPFFTQKFGNPHSAGHSYGWETEGAITRARHQVGSLIKAASPEEEIIFTSGATEANNLAIKGVMQQQTERPHMVTAVSEHKCVVETMKACTEMGCELTILPVNSDGLLDPQKLRAAITDRTALVSIMAVNNEIGVIQNLKDCAEAAHEKGALFHTDAAQAFGKIPLDVVGDAIDMLSISGHKIYGPKGIGALYLRKGLSLKAQMQGGGQEGGLRSGTLSPALCAGLGQAAALAETEMLADQAHCQKMADRFMLAVKAISPDIIMNGSMDHRWAGCINIHIPAVNGDMLMASLRGLAVSNGSACSSGGDTKGSAVLRAIGLTDAQAKASVRVGVGRMTTDAEIEAAIDIFSAALKKLGKG